MSQIRTMAVPLPTSPSVPAAWPACRPPSTELASRWPRATAWARGSDWAWATIGTWKITVNVL